MQLIKQLKNSLILLLSILSSCATINNGSQKKIFKVKDNITFKGYYITFNEDDSPVNNVQFPFEKYEVQNKMRAIEELLTFQGDMRLNFKGLQPLMNNPYSKSINKRDSSITLEVEALFIINYLVFKYKYSLFPCIIDRGERNSDCNSNYNVNKAYDYYKSWFREVQKIGLDSITKGRIFPLDNTELEWY